MLIPNGIEATTVSYYIDLGASSYMAQIAIAVIVGGLATAGFYWRRIRDWFKGFKSGKRNKDS